MKKPAWAKATIQAGNNFHIRHQNPFRHNLTNGLAASILGLALLSPIIASTYLHWIWYPLLGILLGSAFFGYFILIIHEASHNMLFISVNLKRRQTINRKIGTWASVPFFTEYIRHWEEGHVTHHIRPCESDDPQNPNPLYGRALLKNIAKVWLVPFGFMPVNPSAKYDKKLKRMMLGALCWVPVVGLVYIINPLSLTILYIGYATLATLNLCKIAQEHGAGLANEPAPILRSRTYFYRLQWLFSPFNIHYHYEHHANCNVPWYLLPNYHKVVREIIPEDLRRHFIHREYWSQMIGTKELPQWPTESQAVSS